MQTLPITTRTLETIIRLATAHAKCRLSQEVTEVSQTENFLNTNTLQSDAAVAMEIMNYALFHDTTIEDTQSQNNSNNNDNQSKNKRPSAPPQNNAKRQRTQDSSQSQDDMAVDQVPNTANNNQSAFAPPRFVSHEINNNRVEIERAI